MQTTPPGTSIEKGASLTSPEHTPTAFSPFSLVVILLCNYLHAFRVTSINVRERAGVQRKLPAAKARSRNRHSTRFDRFTRIHVHEPLMPRLVQRGRSRLLVKSELVRLERVETCAKADGREGKFRSQDTPCEGWSRCPWRRLTFIEGRLLPVSLPTFERLKRD